MELNKSVSKYELGIVIRANLDEEAQTVEMDRIKALLERFGATIDKEDKWGRRKLAYPIAKQTEGIYTFITYSATSDTPLEVESRVRLMENVLRFLTINLDEVEAQKAKAKTVAPAVVEEVRVEEVKAEEPVVVEASSEEPAAE